MCFRERIITPSIRACPPKANDGSFFKFFDSPHTHRNIYAQSVVYKNVKGLHINAAYQNQKQRTKRGTRPLALCASLRFLKIFARFDALTLKNFD
jgi:hypothetical protein